MEIDFEMRDEENKEIKKDAQGFSSNNWVESRCSRNICCLKY